MRLRNNKNKEQILSSSSYLVRDEDKLLKNKGNWSNLFNNNNPIYLEIGMGKGKFIIDNAYKYPNVNFIGIEKFDNVLVRAVPKLDEKLDNLIIVRMDALNIDEVFSNEIDRLYLNFSDPWPKDRHEKRRLTSKVFLEKYDKIFKDKCDIHLKTDNVDFFNYSLSSLKEHGYKIKEISLDLHKEKENIITTDYEEKFIKEGKKISFLNAEK